jgi:hypothetical protein
MMTVWHGGWRWTDQFMVIYLWHGIIMRDGQIGQEQLLDMSKSAVTSDQVTGDLPMAWHTYERWSDWAGFDIWYN